MSPRHLRSQERGQAAWQGKLDKPVRIITPALRRALAELLESDPQRLIAACVEAQVTSLRQIPAYCELLVTDPWRAAEIAVLAEDAGIAHRI